jgi:hypothetical protein
MLSGNASQMTPRADENPDEGDGHRPHRLEPFGDEEE